MGRGRGPTPEANQDKEDQNDDDSETEYISINGGSGGEDSSDSEEAEGEESQKVETGSRHSSKNGRRFKKKQFGELLKKVADKYQRKYLQSMGEGPGHDYLTGLSAAWEVHRSQGMAKRINDLAMGTDYVSDDEGGKEKRDGLWDEIEASQNAADAVDYLKRFGYGGVRITDQTAFCLYYSWLENGKDMNELDLVTNNEDG